MHSNHRICPVFQVSNVSGTGLDLVKAFLNLLQANRSIEKFDPNQPLEYRINDTFSVTGVGTVVAGTVMSGKFLCIIFRNGTSWRCTSSWSRFSWIIHSYSHQIHSTKKS